MFQRVSEVMGETAVHGLANPFDSDVIQEKENTLHERNGEDVDTPDEVFSVSCSVVLLNYKY